MDDRPVSPGPSAEGGARRSRDEDDEQWVHEAQAKPCTLHAALRSVFCGSVAVPRTLAMPCEAAGGGAGSGSINARACRRQSLVPRSVRPRRSSLDGRSTCVPLARARRSASLPCAAVEQARGMASLPCGKVERARWAASLPCAAVEQARGAASLPCGKVERARWAASLPRAAVEQARGAASLPCGKVERARGLFCFYA
jgi:hypothetical protein